MRLAKTADEQLDMAPARDVVSACANAVTLDCPLRWGFAWHHMHNVQRRGATVNQATHAVWDCQAHDHRSAMCLAAQRT
jgi:hypothetical protein